MNVKTGVNELAVDHQLLASSLSYWCSETIDPNNLPITELQFHPDFSSLGFTCFEKRWRYNCESGECEPLPVKPQSTDGYSPDGNSCIFTQQDGLWIRDVINGQVYRLTSDGTESQSYGGGSTAWGHAPAAALLGLWSADSRRFLTVRRDRRLVEPLSSVHHIPDDGALRPNSKAVKVGYPDDTNIETYQIICIDIKADAVTRADYPPIISNYNEYHGFYNKCLWWGNDNRTAYFVDPERGDQRFHIVELDTHTGQTRKLFTETSKTHITFAGGSHGEPLNRYLPDTNELIWWSERSGWGHLYLYDLTAGNCQHAITQGDWRVRDILHVDEPRRELLIQTSGSVAGRDPYYRDICRVNIDTGERVVVLSEDAELYVPPNGVSPCGNYMVLTRSRIDTAGQSLLIDQQGKTLCILETTDTSKLPDNWQWPQPFSVKAADGETDLYGALFKPSNFTEDKPYPLINYIASGPWIYVTPKASFHSNPKDYHATRHFFYAAALAELGFVVMLLDSRGTPLRSKAFQDHSYGWIPSAANTDDHAHAIDQLAERHSYIDKDRVGIFGALYRSGLQNFLERPDLYKVCVQMGLLDDRVTAAFVGDKYEGLEPHHNAGQYAEELVKTMDGKLLLMHSMHSFFDTCYPPAALFRVVAALQKANKDFDMVVLPEGEFLLTNYMLRRAFDYFTEHLLGDAPPEDFLLKDIAM